MNFYLKKSCLLLFVFACFTCKAQAPVSFYQDSFNGGVTCNGWSPTYSQGAGTGYFSINIYPGSTIHKAYLLAGRVGPAPDITVQLNALNLTFNSSTNVTPIFQQTLYGGNSAVCAIDVTNLISDTVNNYSLTIPYQNSTSDRYQDFYLYVAYNNPALSVVNTAIFLNQSDITDQMAFIPMSLTYPFVNSSDFAVSMFMGYACNTTFDGEYIYFNADSLGLIGGSDTNSGECGETIGSFYYYSGALHALNGSSNNLYMKDSDALSNAASLLPSCTQTTSLSMMFIHQDPQTSIADNNVWGVILAYGAACQNIMVNNDTSICSGASVQLNVLKAIPCSNYKWSPGAGLSNDTVTNPVASPFVTTTYTIIDSSAFCKSSASLVITVDSSASITVMPSPAVVCEGESVTLIAGGADTYQWSPAIGLTATTGDTVVANPTLSTTYTITGETTGGCTGQTAEIVTIIPPPNKPIITKRGDTLFSNGSNGNQWYKNDTIITGATDSFLVLTGNQIGSYKVTVTNVANGCTITSDSLVITGINQLSINNYQLSIYPNPTGGIIIITINSLTADVKNWNLQLTNVLGQSLYTKSSLNYTNEINLSNLSSGVYFVTVANKTERAVFPVIKQN